jgi:acyl carrier protein
MSTDTFAQMAAMLDKRFHVEPGLIVPGAALTELGLDSLSLMEMAFALEDTFSLNIPEDKFDPRQQGGLTLQAICDLIDQMKAA